MSNKVKSKGKIITFYSYKGGTGRSMALANIAVLVARSGFRTLMIDWDLEAPGLHKYFEKSIDRTFFINTPGVTDLFFSIQEQLNRSSKKCSSEKSKKFLRQQNIDNYITPSSISNLFLMKAGIFDSHYERKINTIDWEKIFRNAEDIFFHFGELLTEMFDFVFIDSRTGYTDASGICTMILPEKLALVFTPNSQSLDGVIQLAKKSIGYRENSGDLRPLLIYPLPSRIENAEKELRDKWRSQVLGTPIGYQPAFEAILSELYNVDNIEMTHYFNEVQIQHEAKYAYGEEIAVMNETTKDRLSISESYNRFLNFLLQEQAIWSLKIQKTRKIFLSYAKDDSSFSSLLAKELVKKGFYVWTDSNLTIGGDWYAATQKAIAEADILLPIISSHYINSKSSHFEISVFLEQMRMNESKNVIPILIEDIDQTLLPFNLQSFKWINVAQQTGYSAKMVAQDVETFLTTLDEKVDKKLRSEGTSIKKSLTSSDTSNEWLTISITQKNNTKGSLQKFSYSIYDQSKAKQIDTLDVNINLSMVKSFIDQTLGSHFWSVESANVLYQLLVPKEYKSVFNGKRDIILTLDDYTRLYPWELLQIDGENQKPLCLTSSIIRHFKGSNIESNSQDVSNTNALIIGDPFLNGIVQLPGAYREADMVSNVLESHFKISLILRGGSSDIIQRLLSDTYKILHLAGHGIFDEKDHLNSGMIIGKGVYLTNAEIIQMSKPPDLIVINCCFLGKSNGISPKLYSNRNKLAANFGSLVANGVKGIVVAGWAVDDAAALEFTEIFYRNMCAGLTLSEAVKIARNIIYEKYHTVNNTWGAYQCYGDPFFRL